MQDSREYSGGDVYCGQSNEGGILQNCLYQA